MTEEQVWAEFHSGHPELHEQCYLDNGGCYWSEDTDTACIAGWTEIE